MQGAETKSKPRYMLLADELRDGIAKGTVPADQFPTESVLCARYGVSRFTVREALRALQAEGLIQRRRGSGTTLKAPERTTLHQPLSNLDEILQYARDTRVDYAPHGLKALPRALITELRLDPDQRWVHFGGVRRHDRDETAIAHIDAYINGAYARAAASIDPAAGVLFRQLEAAAGIRIARVTQDIQAVPASKEIAAALGVPKRSPCLRIVRCYMSKEGGFVEISVSHHPGDRFAYAMHTDV
ncbi:GntR family transcriptional regulator [Glacieibacterium frigidum]|nr:GntR family transcriptional regulator [Glacieibacterium frigidum]